jgi:hypothetical protein
MSPGIIAFFVIQYLIVVVQVYWVCQITVPGWKEVPGSICIFPKAVPVTQLTSESSRALVPLFLLIELTPSDDCFGYDLSFYPFVCMTSLFSSVGGVSHPRVQIIKGVHIPALRFRLFGIFSASVITTIASVAHAVAMVDELGVLNPILGMTVLVSTPNDTQSPKHTLTSFAFLRRGCGSSSISHGV